MSEIEKKPITRVLKKDLVERIELLNSQILEEKEKSLKLEATIKELNNLYINKIKEKSTEAQILLSSKKEELINKYKKENDEIKKYAIFQKVHGLITTLQTFEAVLSTPVSDPKIHAYLQGFKMIQENYRKALKDLGIIEIKAIPGQEMDTSIHEPIEVQNHKGYKEGQIIKILNKGYKLHDRVIEPAKVVVAK